MAISNHVWSKTEKTALLIDGANFFSSLRYLGKMCDYKKLLSYFQDNVRLVRAYYYSSIVEGSEFDSLRPLSDWLAYNGFTLVKKITKEYTDSVGRKRIKGNMDVEIACDALEIADRIDHAVLFSGDGDLRRLVEALQRKAVKVTVVSTLGDVADSKATMIADDLRRQADQFVDLSDIIEFFERPMKREDEKALNMLPAFIKEKI